jgi:hypothetical protein
MANNNNNNPPLHGFAAAVLQMYQGELVEINTGEVKTTHVLDQFSHDIKHLIRGTVVDAIGDAIIIDCPLGPGTEKRILINCWSINSICKYHKGHSLSDAYWDADKHKANK